MDAVCKVSLTVAGIKVPDDHLGFYVIRFHGIGQASLFYLGRRVTEAWQIDLEADVPADDKGGSA